MIKIGERVTTPDGYGVVVDYDTWGITRIGVKLDRKKFFYSPAYYFKNEVKEVINENNKTQK